MVETGEEVGAKHCPMCREIIRQSRRYGNLLKKCYVEVQDVTKNIFGNLKKLHNGQAELVKKIRSPAWRSIVPESMTLFLTKSLTEDASKAKIDKGTGKGTFGKAQVLKSVIFNRLHGIIILELT